MKAGNQTGLRFVLLSLAGVLLFFVPVYQGMIPVVLLINEVKKCFGAFLPLVSAVSCLLLTAELFVHRQLFKEQGLRCLFWLASGIIVVLKLSGLPIPVMVHPQIGGTVLVLGSTVFITIAVAGTLVAFIISSGIVEFVSVLMEPVMTPLFHLPGEAAVNILSSFVSSASVGVYFTERYYVSGRYTRRQACSVVTSFSVVSVGYIGIIASLAGISNMYGTLLVSSFVLVLVMGAVMIRIPPLCRIGNLYIDGRSPKDAERKPLRNGSRLLTAWEAGREKAADFTLKTFVDSTWSALGFAQKIVGVMIPTVMLVLILVYYTPLFTWIGLPLVPVLQLLGIEDAAMAAPSVLIGIVEVSLPSILIGGTGAAASTRFFVALLSIVQIIFFSEAGNAIMGSRIPLGAWKLTELFLVRTAIALPMVALVTHLIY